MYPSHAETSYPSVLEATVKDSFAKVGIRSVVQNRAEETTSEEAFCLEDEEEDVDVLTRDFLTGSEGEGADGRRRRNGGGQSFGSGVPKGIRSDPF